jgi:tetratricopeptide (TPR) repeat protein
MLAADAAADRGLRLGTLTRETTMKLDALMHEDPSRVDLIDVGNSAPPELLADAVKLAIEDPNVDAVVALHVPRPGTPAVEAAAALARVAPAHRKPLLADSKRAGDDAGLLFARGWAQLDAGELRAARGSAKELAALVAPKAGAGADADDNLTYPRIMARLLDGALLVREGKAEQGLEVMRAATKEFEAQPVEFGPPVTVKPPRELLGEALLAAGRKAEAKAEFERALAAAPERRASKAGLAQASGVQPATH